MWCEASTFKNGQKISPSYGVVIQGLIYSIEFINNHWYHIDWDDDDHFGYWTHPNRKIAQEDLTVLGLGWVGRPIDVTTPTNLHVPRERAATTSTQADEPPTLEEQDNGEDEMDKNPTQTEQLAEELYARSTIQGIAEELDPAQDRTHYLPAHVPSASILKPVSLNPGTKSVRIASARTAPEEIISATTNTTKLITNAIKLDGSLKGKVPDSFNGDRTKTTKFMNEFDLFWMNIEEMSNMNNHS